MKWIIIIFGVGIIRGVLFPDYRFSANVIIIPFLMPLFLASLSTYLGVTKGLSLITMSIFGLLSVYLSTLIGIAVYGYSVGWRYVTDDGESQAVFAATLIAQTVIYLIALGVSLYIARRYNKRMQTDQMSATRPFGR